MNKLLFITLLLITPHLTNTGRKLVKKKKQPIVLEGKLEKTTKTKRNSLLVFADIKNAIKSSIYHVEIAQKNIEDAVSTHDDHRRRKFISDAYDALQVSYHNQYNAKTMLSEIESYANRKQILIDFITKINTFSLTEMNVTQKLDINNLHKVNTLFSSLLTHYIIIKDVYEDILTEERLAFNQKALAYKNPNVQHKNNTPKSTNHMQYLKKTGLPLELSGLPKEPRKLIKK